MKKFLDIEVARLTDDEFKTSNTGGFEKGDRVQITEKVDGSNASIAWADGTLKAMTGGATAFVEVTANGSLTNSLRYTRLNTVTTR